jgi:predicted O-linked N-acetylglucosamine transferase (SPINDLY family)
MNLAKAVQNQGRSAEALALFEQVAALAPGHAEAEDARLCALSYQPEVSPEALLAEHRNWAARLMVRPDVGHPNDRTPDRPLRVGYISGDLRRHPVGFFLSPVVAAHDAAHVQTICYSNDPRADAMTARLRGASTGWREIFDLDDDAAARMIGEDEIDLLVDLSGHTPGHRLPLLARRPAPVQAAWLGYAASTGLGAIDYLVVDPWTAPVGAEAWCSEALVRLPHARFCYGPPEDAPPPGPPPSIARGQVTFGSFNNLAKLNSEVVQLWAAVLAAAPGSRLVLKWTALDDESVRRRITALFAAAGVAEDALELRGFSPHHQTLAEYADIDIALDPFPFCGGLTSCEALWMGVPVVTWPKDSIASRQTLAFLETLGLGDLAAGSAEAYVAIAAALAADTNRRAQLRQTLRSRMTASPLCDAGAFTANLEAAYRQMWRRWCAGQPAEGFDLTSAGA